MDNLTEQFPGPGGPLAGGDAFQVAFYALVSMLVIVGLAHLASRMLHNRRLGDWAKEEFLQVLVSAALVGGLVALMAPDNGIIIKAFQSLVPANAMTIELPAGVSIPISQCEQFGIAPGSIICYAFDYIGQVQNQILIIIASLFGINMVLDIISKISVDIIVVQITPLSGLSAFVQVFNSMIQTLTFLEIMTVVEKSLLAFANATALSVFLPIGIVLRCFFATRRIGGALIAIAVGAYLIFPLCIALNGVAVQHAKADAYEPITNATAQIAALTPYGSQFNQNGTLNPDTTRSYMDKVTGAASSIVGAVQAIPNAVATFIGTMIVEVVILPVVALMITMIVIKELAGVFGGEVNLSKFEV